jgi:hypothetical protein
MMEVVKTELMPKLLGHVKMFLKNYLVAEANRNVMFWIQS